MKADRRRELRAELEERELYVPEHTAQTHTNTHREKGITQRAVHTLTLKCALTEFVYLHILNRYKYTKIIHKQTYIH